MAIIITDQYKLRQANFLDDRKGLASSVSSLKNWDYDIVPIPEGFEVYVGGIWYIYKSSHSEDPDLGKFRTRNTDQGIDDIETELRALQFDETCDSATSFSDLLSETFWEDEDGVSHVRPGRIVTVTEDEDESKNGPWYLTNSDYTEEASWIKLLDRSDIEALDSTDTKVYGTKKADQVFPKKDSSETISGSWTFTENSIFTKDLSIGGDTEFGDGTASIKVIDDKSVATFNKVITDEAEIGNLDDKIVEKLGLIGVGNLLKNTGLQGQRNSKYLNDNTNLYNDTGIYSDVKEDWKLTTSETQIIPDNDSISGFSFYLPNPNTQIIQDSAVNLRDGADYVLSWKQKGDLVLKIDDYDLEIKKVERPVVSGYDCFYTKFKQTGTRKVEISFSGGPGYVCEIKLEEGIIPTTWFPSLFDTDPVANEIHDYEYINTAFSEYHGDGLVSSLFLKNQIKVGDHVNGEVENIKGGLNGVYIDQRDVLFWAGSSYQDAQKLAYDVIKNPELLDNLNYSELQGLTKAIITFGSRSIFTDIYAHGKLVGEFKGSSEGEHTGTFTGTIKNTKGEEIINKKGLSGILITSTNGSSGGTEPVEQEKRLYFVNGCLSMTTTQVEFISTKFSDGSIVNSESYYFSNGLCGTMNGDFIPYTGWKPLYNLIGQPVETHYLYFNEGYLVSVSVTQHNDNSNWY